jgi:hypothetical protein
MAIIIHNYYMRPLTRSLAILALTGAFAISAKADLLYIGAVDFNNGPNGPPESNLVPLNNFLPGDQSGLLLLNNWEDLNGSPTTINVIPGSFLVVHYGKGKGGLGHGGSWEFFQVINNETLVTVPGKGNGPTNPDLFGHGGISSIREFGTPPTTPDSGATVMLLGVGIGSVELLRRLVSRKQALAS